MAGKYSCSPSYLEDNTNIEIYPQCNILWGMDNYVDSVATLPNLCKETLLL